jgi:hypothetical protein
MYLRPRGTNNEEPGTRNQEPATNCREKTFHVHVLVLWVTGVGWGLLGGCGRPEDRPVPAAPTNGTGPGTVEPAWFEEFNVASGLAFVHQVDVSGSYLFSESMASGGALVDFDNDGRLDVLLIHNVNPALTAATNRLFHQEPDGHFKDVSVGSGLERAGPGQGLAVGDLNNDGLPEILITEYDRVRLFLNEGRGSFREVTALAGITNNQWSIAAAFFDYDRDGWLDLVLGNYLDFDPGQKCLDARGHPDFCGPHGFPSTMTRLFRNVTGRAGASGGLKFEDVTVASGIGRVPGKAMGIVCADFDGDHWPDVMIADDELPNRLFINLRDGRFREEGVVRGIAYTGTGGTAANMGIALGDADGDGLFDLFVPHLTEENHTLWRQGPQGVFLDATAGARLLAMPWHGTGFGAVLADFDLDGNLDLAVVNGRIRRAPRPPRRVASGVPSFWAPYAEPAQLFVNEGSGKFREVSPANAAVCGEARVGRGLVCGDLDNDGALDLVVTAIGSGAKFFRNTAARRGHWLGVRAVDPALGGRDAYGAEIQVRVGSRTWWRVVQPAYSYASSNDPRAHFGLGPSTEFEQLRVIWPDGLEESFPGGAADRYMVVRRGSGVGQPPAATQPGP